jgi:isoleucyl-tRNA synthetase
VLHRLSEVEADAHQAYRDFDFKRVMSTVVNFAVLDLSALYFDIRKDALYCDPRGTAGLSGEALGFAVRRRAARTVMLAVFERLIDWLKPVMPFTTEEAFSQSPMKAAAASVHLYAARPVPDEWRDEALGKRWEKIFRVRKVVTGALEVERREKRIGASLESAPDVYIADADLLAAFDGEPAADLFITSGAKLMAGAGAPVSAFRLPEEPGVAVVHKPAIGVKCRRSWKYFDPATALPDYPDITPRDAWAVKALG